jgi:DNA-binding XRE family transcriptional regulator
MERQMSGKSYAQLLKLIEGLITTGARLSDPSTGTPSAKIHHWIKNAEDCLSLLEEKIPTEVSEFRRLRQKFEFKVEDYEEDSVSASAYRPEGTDVLLDFSFEHLKQATDILKLAAKKLPSDPSDEKLGEKLRAARLLAGHTQREAAEKIGYEYKAISEWETGKRKPRPKAAKDIRDYIGKPSKLN